MERSIIDKGFFEFAKQPNKVYFYDRSEEPIGASQNKLVYWIRVEVLKSANKLLYHGYPVLEEEVPPFIRSKFESQSP